MDRPKRLLIVTPQLEARTRLRDALRDVVGDAEVEVVATFREAKTKVRGTPTFDVIFIGYSGLLEDVSELVMTCRRVNARPLRFIIVLPNPQVDANHVAALFADGVEGFIAEPFSFEELNDLFKAIHVHRDQDPKSARDMRMLGFLTSQLQFKIDELASIQARSPTPFSRLPKNFAKLRETLNSLHQSDPEAFTQILLSKYENVPVPKTRATPKKRKIAAEPRHPGIVLKELLEQRGIGMERIMILLGISAGELEELMGGQRAVDEKLAHNLARAVGETSRYWSKMQNEYDKWLAVKQKPVKLSS